jgi:CRISPR-associated endonuclease/helicase Cas3
MSVSIDDFVPFHRAVHGHAPFQWQERLLRKVHAERSWPRVLDLPTGAGKTTCIDIALFALALDAQRPSNERWCPRRVAMVVDRRVVVDQVAERGRKILAVLMASREASVVAVRYALASLTGPEEEPIGVYTLRGGIPKDDGWARTPDQPLVLASTVDQLGSRLLIQGYGVSVGMRPIHAGLLANDALVLLDEVHLSRPFAETLDAVSRLRATKARAAPSPPARFHHVFLSATPGDAAENVFRLDPKEREVSSPLGSRLHTKKPARLEKVATRDELAAMCGLLVHGLLERHRVVAVVVNRVATARQTVRSLRESLPEAVHIVLLTGRMRPLDRDDVLAQYRPRIAAGRDRAASPDRLVVVGTQCIEAGADFDFDAMVTESASLDALRQRFGRVDRLGDYGSSEAAIVHVEDDGKEDPIYGAARAKTWSWLGKQVSKKTKTVDFGVEALLALQLRANADDLAAPKKRAPTLLPAYLDLWMQTSPEPAVAPDPALFLHGPESGPADVQLVWRVDLEEMDLDPNNKQAAGAVAAIVGAIRPSSLETVSVPFTAALSWLRGDLQDNVMDVDSVVEQERQDRAHSPRTERPAFRWRGAGSEVITWQDLRPGDTIVVPCQRGGLRESSFDPTSTEAVVDLAERAALLSRGRPVLRLHPSVLSGLGLPAIDDADDLRDVARAARQVETVAWRKAWLAGLLGRCQRMVVEAGERDPWVVVQGNRFRAAELRAALGDAPEQTVENGADLTTDDEDSFHAGRGGITLAEHSGDVESYAWAYADKLGLPDALRADLALAGWLHDIGKADPRFQLLLRGGDEVEFYKDERPWAKSIMRPGAKRAQALARRLSKYPAGARHEVQSLAMIHRVRDVLAAKASDLELVLYLVASHHGYCRPFAPPVPDPEPVDVGLVAHASAQFGSIDFPATSTDHRLHRLDSPLADRFWDLVERYGWFELCWLEAILRLADHRASEAEEACCPRGGVT